MYSRRLPGGVPSGASVFDIQQNAGLAERFAPPGSKALVALDKTKGSALVPKKAPTMPKPSWHPPWKLYRVGGESVW